MLVVGKVQNVYRMIDKGNYMKTIIMNMKDYGILVCQQHIRKQRRHACIGNRTNNFWCLVKCTCTYFPNRVS